MATLIDGLGELVRWMSALPPLWIYGTVFAIAYLENVVPPIPGDMVVVFGGYMVGAAGMSFAGMVVLSTLGGVLGFMTVYGLGYWVGEALLEADEEGWVPVHRVEKARAWLDRYGYGLVAANRFLSGLRSVISLTVGMARLRALPVTVYATLSAAAWCTLMVAMGYFVGDNWRIVGDYLSRYGWAVLGAAALYVAYRIIYGFFTARRDREGAESS